MSSLANYAHQLWSEHESHISVLVAANFAWLILVIVPRWYLRRAHPTPDARPDELPEAPVLQAPLNVHPESRGPEPRYTPGRPVNSPSIKLEPESDDDDEATARPFANYSIYRRQASPPEMNSPPSPQESPTEMDLFLTRAVTPRATRATSPSAQRTPFNRPDITPVTSPSAQRILYKRIDTAHAKTALLLASVAVSSPNPRLIVEAIRFRDSGSPAPERLSPGDLVLRPRPARFIRANTVDSATHDGPFIIASCSNPAPEHLRKVHGARLAAWAELQLPATTRAGRWYKEQDLILYSGPITQGMVLANMEDVNGTYIMDTIRGERGNGKKREFRISWRGWPSEDDTWEDVEKVKEADNEMAMDYERRRDQLKRDAMIVA